MKFRVTCMITFEYEVKEDVKLAEELERFRDNHDMFFEIASVEDATYTFTGKVAE